jgi:tetratricopeptide (TPR) repeat protein
MKQLRIKIAATIAVISVTLFSTAQAQSSQELMYEAYITSSKILWQKAVNNAEDNSWEKAEAYYGLLNSTMQDEDEKLFDKNLEPALDLLSELELNKEHKADALALKSSIYGLIMAYSPWKGMTYGGKSSKAISEAAKLNPLSPIVLSMQGGNLYYTPESFGGDKSLAIEKYKQSVSRFEAMELTARNWMYLQALANLGQAYAGTNKNKEAIDSYEKALRLEPKFYYVSKYLLPQVQK